jgi:hypothetical protein
MFNYRYYVELNQQLMSPFLKEKAVKICLYLSLLVVFYTKLAASILANEKHLVASIVNQGSLTG